MKVLLVNGSPHKNGCTYTALSEVAKVLNEEDTKTDIYWIGNKPIGGCIGCFACAKKKQCVFNDIVNDFTAKAAEYDGFIFGSPVYYSGMNGSLMSFMDRVFFSASVQEPHPFRFKPAAAVVSARRAGTTSTLDLVNPDNWASIEQVGINDGYSYRAPALWRLSLQNGTLSRTLDKDMGIEGINRMIPGGAATLVEMAIDPTKELQSLHLESLSNDVVIGLMGITVEE